MAAESDTGSGFGAVSRRKGIVFEYLLIASTLIGVASLFVLLTYVALDAFGLTATEGGRYVGPEPAWYLVYLAAVVLPTGALSLHYYYRNRAAGERGATALALLVAGLFASASAVVFFVVVDPLVYFSYVVGLALTAAVWYGHRRLRPTAAFTERAGLTAFVGWAALVGLPEAPFVAALKFVYGLAGLSTDFNGLVGLPVPSIAALVQRLPVVPDTWSIYLLSVVLPAAATVGVLIHRREESYRTGLVAGAVVVSVVAGGSFVLGLVAPVDRASLALALLFSLTPVGYYTYGTISNSEADASSLAFPVVVIAGIGAAVVAVDVLGIRSPPSWVDWQFVTSLPSSQPEAAGVYPALVGSVMLMLVVAALAFPIGVGAAVYLEEYARGGRFTRFVQVNISNLAGVPSVVYGLLGLGVLVNFLGFGLGSLLVGGATLALLILPIVIISAQEAIRSVPDSQRQASYGMGATTWQTVRNVVLPRAFPGILTGTILALGRAVGETAPLIMVGAAQTTFSVPTSLNDTISALPMQIYAWAFQPSHDFSHGVLAAGVVVILTVMLTMNSIAIVLRNRYQTQ